MSGLILKNLMHVEIAGSGVAFPDQGKWVNNEDIHSMLFGTDWLETMREKNLHPAYYEKELGLKKRYWVHTPGERMRHDELTSADLMIAAANAAIASSPVKKEDIDVVIAVTITSPKYTTSMGAYVAGKLGVHAPAFEMKSGCAGNIFSITLASQLIQGGARNVLIVSGETNSKIVQPATNMMYAGGDAGAAIILSKTTAPGKGILAAYMNSEGSYSSHMGVQGLMPPNLEDVEQQNYYLSYNDAAEVFLNQVWSETPGILYEAANLNPENIDWLIPHQVLKKRIEFISEAAHVPLNKTINILPEIANCGSVTILVALDHARKNNLLKKDQIALLVAAGGGISWGGLILKT